MSTEQEGKATASADVLVEVGELKSQTGTSGEAEFPRTISGGIDSPKSAGDIPSPPTRHRFSSIGSQSTVQPSGATNDDQASNVGSDEKLTGNKKTGSTQHTSRIKRFKRRIWIFQLLMIICVVALCSSEIGIAQNFFKKSKRDAAEVALDILEESHDFLKSVVLSISDSKPLFVGFLSGAGYSLSEIENKLDKEATPFHVEINTIVNANKQIVASAFDKRHGTVFDPNGLVTKLFDSFSGGPSAQSFKQMFTILEISREEFEAANAPFYLSSDADGYGNRYTIRKHGQGLMMFGVGAIISDDGNTLLGAKVVGYLLTGKQKLVQTALAAIGKEVFAGVWHKKSDSQFDFSQFLLANGLSESRTYTDYRNDYGDINSVYETNGKIHDVQTVDEEEFSIILTNVPKGIVIRNFDGAEEEEYESAQGALFVGKSNAFVDGQMATNTVAIVAFLVGTVLVILVNAALADRFFIQPIHQLVIAVDKKDNAKLNAALEKMKDLKLAIVTVSAGFVAMIGLLGGMLLYNHNSISHSFLSQSSAWSKQRYFELFYRERQQEHFVDANGMALNPNFIDVLDSQAITNNIYVKVVEKLQYYALEHEVELALVLNTSLHVVASATTLPEVDTVFDPNGIVSEILRSRGGIRANILMPRDLYFSLNPASFGDSSLRVEMTDHLAAIQFTGVPIFGSASDEPTGILVLGSVLNGGKSDIIDRAILQFGDSCAAVFYINNGEPIMIASAFSAKSGFLQSDAPIDTDEVRAMVLESSEHGEFIDYESVEILGEDFELSTEQVFPGSQYDSDGHEHLSREFDDEIYLVQCHSKKAWNRFTSTIKVISSVTFCALFVASLVLTYVTFKPIYEFGQRYERKWSAKTASSGNRLSLGSVVNLMGSFKKSSVGNSSRHGSVG